MNQENYYVCGCRRAESTGSNSADWVEEVRGLAGPGLAPRDVDGPVLGGPIQSDEDVGGMRVGPIAAEERCERAQSDPP